MSNCFREEWSNLENAALDSDQEDYVDPEDVRFVQGIREKLLNVPSDKKMVIDMKDCHRNANGFPLPPWKLIEDTFNNGNY